MKIVGVFLLILVASASAWPFSLFGDEEKKEEKSDVILNYDAGDHKHIQTGKPGEKVHGIFSVKEESGKVRTTSYRADKEGFNAEINEEDSSKHSEKQVEEKKPVDEKVIEESLKKDEEKKDEDKVKIGEKIKEEDKDKLEKEEEKVEKDLSKKKEEKDEFEKEEEKVEKDSTKKKDEKDWVKKDEEKNKLGEKVKVGEKVKEEKDWVKKDEEKNKVGEKVKIGENNKEEEKGTVDEKEVNEKDEDSDRKEAVKKGEFEELVKDQDVKGPLLGLISAALREEFKHSSHKPKHHANVQPHDYYPHVQYVPVSPYATPYHGMRHRRAFFAPAYYY